MHILTQVTKPKKMRYLNYKYTLNKMDGHSTYFIIRTYHCWFNSRINYTFKSFVNTDLIVVLID
jgi:hypothetical protein